MLRLARLTHLLLLTAVEAFSVHTPKLLHLILAPADPSPAAPHPFATGLRDWCV
jgi:hypothetical protein